MSRKISLPASAHECAASATIDAEPVMTATTDFASAMSAFIASAMMTVSRLSLFCRPALCFSPLRRVSHARPAIFRSGVTCSRALRWQPPAGIPDAGVCRSAPSHDPPPRGYGASVAHDVEARPRVTGIPRARRLVLDRHLAVGALDDDGRRERARARPAAHGEAVVLDEHRLPARRRRPGRRRAARPTRAGSRRSTAGASVHIGIAAPARAKIGMRSSGVATVIR